MPYYGYKGRLVYFAYAKNHIGLYPVPPITEMYSKELAHYKTGKATIQFPLSEKLPIALIKRLVKARIKINEESAKNKFCYTHLMVKISASEKIYVALSKVPESGRGVFARSDIKKGEIIESCPMIEISEHDFANVNQSFLINYFYSSGEKENLLIPLGFGAIYNHTYEPNATYNQRPEERIMEFVAIKDIKKDEEITVNYNHGDPKDKTPLWLHE